MPILCTYNDCLIARIHLNPLITPPPSLSPDLHLSLPKQPEFSLPRITISLRCLLQDSWADELLIIEGLCAVFYPSTILPMWNVTSLTSWLMNVRVTHSWGSPCYVWWGWQTWSFLLTGELRLRLGDFGSALFSRTFCAPLGSTLKLNPALISWLMTMRQNFLLTWRNTPTSSR